MATCVLSTRAGPDLAGPGRRRHTRAPGQVTCGCWWQRAERLSGALGQTRLVVGCGLRADSVYGLWRMGREQPAAAASVPPSRQTATSLSRLPFPSAWCRLGQVRLGLPPRCL
jgi:hypothetical protein